jgi:hypothetical protein
VNQALVKGGEILGDKEGSEEEEEITPPEANAGGKATCLRHYRSLTILPT